MAVDNQITSEKTQDGDANLCRHLHYAAEHIPTHLAVAVQSHSKRIRTYFSQPSDAIYHELNFAELNQQSDDLAFAIEQHGIHAGMKAVLMVSPSLEFFALTFALFKAGVIPILVDPGMGVKNLKQCFIESEPDVFIGIPKAHLARQLFGWGKASVTQLITVDDGSTLGKLVKCGTSFKSLAKLKKDQPYPMVRLGKDQMAAILFTSGSTGTPKGVVYSHGMFEAQISALKHDYGIKPGERDLATFPLFSLFGPALGMASIVPDMDASKPITANPDYLFAAINEYQCSNMFVNPALIERLGQAGAGEQRLGNIHQLSSVKRVISAGAPATIASIARFSKMLAQDVEVLNSYGATESLPLSKIGSQTLFTTTEITDTGGGICVGQPIQGVDIAIIEIDEAPIPLWTDAKQLAANHIGEIVVKGPMVSQSYYHRDSATHLAKIIDGETVRHRMGDLGYLDDLGQLWMCGRKAHRVDADATIKQAATRYFSIPCERIFNTHNLVKRSALVGVTLQGKVTPLVCIELQQNIGRDDVADLYGELLEIAQVYQQTQGIKRFLIHPSFPVDIRHNAKIFREKLAVWAQDKIKE